MTRPLRFLGSSSSSSSTPSSSSSAVATVDALSKAVAVESDFVLILATLLYALICVVGLIAVARYAWLRRGASENGGSSVAPNKWLKKKILQSLLKFTYDSTYSPPPHRSPPLISRRRSKSQVSGAICIFSFYDFGSVIVGLNAI
ncbi:hypothetical protein U1Q18_034435 [Sarracenia purpurea var. burkii]